MTDFRFRTTCRTCATPLDPETGRALPLQCTPAERNVLEAMARAELCADGFVNEAEMRDAALAELARRGEKP